MLAAERGYAEVVRLLVEAGADKDVASNRGNTALMLAALEGHAEVVRVLVEAGADMNMADSYGNTARMLAADEGHAAVVQLLMEAGAGQDMADRLQGSDDHNSDERSGFGYAEKPHPALETGLQC